MNDKEWEGYGKLDELDENGYSIFNHFVGKISKGKINGERVKMHEKWNYLKVILLIEKKMNMEKNIFLEHYYMKENLLMIRGVEKDRNIGNIDQMKNLN